MVSSFSNPGFPHEHTHPPPFSAMVVLSETSIRETIDNNLQSPRRCFALCNNNKTSIAVSVHSNNPISMLFYLPARSHHMGSTSAISLCSHPKILMRPQRSGSAFLGYRGQGMVLPAILPRRRRCLAVKAASRPSGVRRVYRESQSGGSLSVAPVKQLASIVPAASFLAVTFGDASEKAVKLIICFCESVFLERTTIERY